MLDKFGICTSLFDMKPQGIRPLPRKNLLNMGFWNTVHKDVMENVENSIQVPAEIHLGPKNAWGKNAGSTTSKAQM